MTTRLMAATAVISLATALAPAPAFAQDQTYRLNIPAMDLGDALRAFGRATRQQVVFSGAAVRGRRSNAIDGSYSARDALGHMIEGSGLSIRVGSGGIFMVAPGNGETPVSGEAEAGGAAADSESAESNATPDILVVGRRTLNADIRRTENDTQPYVVLTSEDIQQSQVRSVEEFLMTRLPMNTNQGFAPQSTGNAFGNTGRVNLRGLGVAQTLILLDGRRLPNSNAPGAFQQPDINSIPVSAIERIEVLPATAAGIYGGGATGGAVNIILRRSYTGLELGANYSVTSRGDASAYRLDGSAGLLFEGGRTEIMVSGGYSSTQPLFARDRDFTERGRALQLASNPAAFFGATAPPQGYNGNIRSANGSNLVLDNGTALNSPFTFIPGGYAGVQTDGGQALVRNAGQYDLALPDDSSGRRQSLTSAHDEASVLLSARRKFTDWLEIFADGSWSRNFNRSYPLVTTLNTVTLAAGAANNPFTTPIIVRFANPSVATPFEVEFETLRVAGGAIIRLPAGWRASTDLVWARSRYLNSFSNAVQSIGDPDGTGPGISAQTALANRILDPVRDVNVYPLNWAPYLLPAPNTIRGPGLTFFRDFNFRLSGPLIQLPAGPVNVTAVFENREESLRATLEEATNNSGLTTITFNSPRSQRVNSLYLETIVPLISSANARPFLDALELQGTVRHDWYRTASASPFTATLPSSDAPFPALTNSVNEVQATGYTIGLRYQPFSGLVLRASYGEGFLPPTINQIVPVVDPPITESLIDPKRGEVPRTITFDRIGFGNPDLEAETSKSLTIGAILEPDFLPGFRLSVDYVRISKRNEIFSSGARQTFLDLEDLLPGRIVRAPLTAADAALGYTGGVITLINTSPFNTSRTRLHAIDIQADQQLDLGPAGRLRLYAVATRQPELRRSLLPNAPFVDSAGFTSGPLEWRVNAGFNWTVDNATLSWNAQYYDSYFAYSSTASAATIASTILNQGAARIPSQIYHDVSLRMNVGGRGRNGLTLSLGVQNVFDERPPILATTATSGGYSTYGDPWLRRINIGARVRF